MAETYFDWTLQLERVPCGKADCVTCPHGPYWYGYRRRGTRTQKKYMGKYRLTEPSPFPAEYLTDVVRKVAFGIWQDRDEDSCPVLADALEESGFTDVYTLTALRNGYASDRVAWRIVESIVMKPWRMKWR